MARGGVLASLLSGLLFWEVFLAPASAGPAPLATCSFLHEWVDNIRVDSGGNHVQHRGTRATTPQGMKVSDSSPTPCDRVSSIVVVHDNYGNEVEAGWSEWDLARGDDPFCDNGYGTSLPRRLVFAFIAGTPYCFPSSGQRPSMSDGFHTFEIANALLDGDFDVYVDGTDVRTFETGWNGGWSVSNTERDDPNDGMHGRFEVMQYQDGTGWHDWENRACWYDTSSDWDTVTGSQGTPADVEVSQAFNSHTCDDR